jgi:hypothetical protein
MIFCTVVGEFSLLARGGGLFNVKLMAVCSLSMGTFYNFFKEKQYAR